MSDKIWVRSKWQREELDAKSVEFKLPVQDGEAVGVGQFVVSQSADGLLSINIRTLLRADNPSDKPMMHDFHLNQWAADRIEKHPDKKSADFRCVA
jgi:hypothetical protein